MADIPRLLTTAEVAEGLGVPLTTFYRTVAYLRAARGFPVPVLSGRYDPEAVTAWLARQRTEAMPFPSAARLVHMEAEGRDITAWQVELDRRLDGLARDGRAA